MAAATFCAGATFSSTDATFSSADATFSSAYATSAVLVPPSPALMPPALSLFVQMLHILAAQTFKAMVGREGRNITGVYKNKKETWHITAGGGFE